MILMPRKHLNYKRRKHILNFNKIEVNVCRGAHLLL
uniref:Uncharacterized protein n=1 Tax=Arundo donax TaxID=35708 RepID=A0A0A9C7M8_ARUDO